MTYPNTQLFIRGEWQDAADGKTLAVYNPATGKEIGRVAHAGKADLDRALAAAQEGFEKWRDLPAIERNKIKQSDDLREMLEHALEFERTAVRHYAEALELAVDDRPLVVLLEDLILEEQDGVDEIEKLLREEGTAAAAAPKKAAKGKVG